MFFDKTKLQKSLRQMVESKIYSRGLEYYRDGLVGKLNISQELDQIKISATVSGSDNYDTEIFCDSESGEFSDSECDCPYDWGTCKHVAALGLKFIAESQNKIIEVESFREKKPAITSKDVVEILREKLRSIGLDTEKIPAEILAALENSLSPASEEKTVVPVEAKPPVKFLAMKKIPVEERYHFIFKAAFDHVSLKIKENRQSSTYASWYRGVDDILDEEKDVLTPVQKELLESLVGDYSWREDFDWWQVLTLLSGSGFKVYLERRGKNNEMVFNHEPEKIKAKFFLVDRKKFFGAEERTEKFFVFQPDFVLPNKNRTQFFVGEGGLAVFSGQVFDFFEVSPVGIEFLKRWWQKESELFSYYGFDERPNRWQIDLNEEEIINVNQLVEDLKKVFALSTELSLPLTVEKGQTPQPTLLVDYDGQNASFQATISMDYDFDTEDIGSIIFVSRRFGKENLGRRGNEKNYHIKIDDQGKVCYAPIDEKKEKAVFTEFSDNSVYGFSRYLKCKRSGPKAISLFLENQWPKLQNSGYPIKFLRDRLDFTGENFHADFDIDFSAANDLLSFDVACYCGQDKITVADLKKYLENKEGFLKTADGRLLKITNRAELEKFILMLQSFYQKANQKFEGKLYHAMELDGTITGSEHYLAATSAGFKKFIAEAQSGRPVEKVKIPVGWKKVFRDYQQEGIYWLYFLRKYRFGGILADDMGLGKTLQALGLIEMNKVAKKPSLVICPKTLLFNWEAEAKKFFPRLKVLTIDGSISERAGKLKKIKNFDLIITTYPSLKKDEKIYTKLIFNYCIIDEAQFVKNHKTQSAKAVKSVQADYRLALTGTPLENSVSEIWSIFDFLMPGFLGNYNFFKRKYQTPIMKYADPEALIGLKKKISCFMLRRTKDKVLKELPPKIEQVHHCQLVDDQNLLYQEVLANVKSEVFEAVKIKGFAKAQIHVLAGLTKLRQVCNHPNLLLKNKNYNKYRSAKLEVFLALVENITSAGGRVLVFSQFTTMLDILSKELSKNKIEHNYLSGQTENRKELVEDFSQNKNKQVFLISLKAGGTGLNLVAADHVIIFDPWWNPSVENQAIDRAHRIGQKKTVNVFRLITKGTIEEKIVKLQEKKKNLFDNLVGESGDLFKKLTWAEVKELFE
jgi:superfamily II DNA or RNA helicase